MVQAHGPWTIVQSRPIYKDPWIDVRCDEVIRPDGTPGTHSHVQMKCGVSVLPLDEEGYVYLTEEFHYGVGHNTIEVVSGGIETGEEPLAAAQRETLEELGIVARDWVSLGRCDPFTTMAVSPTSLFLARGLQFQATHPEATELIRCVRVTLETAVGMVCRSEITQGPSCTLILKARLYLDPAGERYFSES